MQFRGTKWARHWLQATTPTSTQSPILKCYADFAVLARNYVSNDILRRILRDYFGFEVDFVQNITDVSISIPVLFLLN
jgi:hypothetical protein